MTRLSLSVASVLTLVLAACGGPKAPTEPSVRHIKPVQVPAIVSDAAEALEYVMEHYWDSFFSGTGATDTTFILGVPKGEVEQHLSNYIAILQQSCAGVPATETGPLRLARKSVSGLFSKVEQTQRADTSSAFFIVFNDLVSHYLYDPNSPLRNEDLYLPYVKALSESPLTREDMRTAYRFEASMCSLNQFGDKAPDFAFRTLKGRNLTLYGVRADYVMLFFSNPGCQSCKGIIDEVQSRPYIDGYIASGKLAVINVYIDEEVDKWREYAPTYPKNWLSGYDYRFTIRSDEQYNVRAIPSLYLLDSEKRVLMKDVPTDKVLSFLDQIEK